MFFTRHQGLTYACFSNLSACPGVFHAFFTRLGHRSQTGLKETDFSTADSTRQNRTRAARCTGAADLVFLSQVHGTNVSVISSPVDIHEAAANAPEADAIISGLPGAGLTVRTADCQAVLLHDPVGHTTAAIHSGWRGSIADIIGRCIHTMRKKFGTDPENLIAGIGPSLGPCCAEFVHYETEIPEKFWKYKDDQHRFDFWQISVDQLRAAGVRKSQIELSHMCTRCNPRLFFSYRGEKATGRMAAVIGLKKEKNRTQNE
ncbi:MAG: peptidoglycan editing factor PgeF [Desulfobacteraceae bacterium]|nr:peptidoglycan editing factor PgeF [Desulfobacteraceae bacterium]